jgi:hypothetical protein
LELDTVSFSASNLWTCYDNVVSLHQLAISANRESGKF